jgi:hypothetical protein
MPLSPWPSVIIGKEVECEGPRDKSTSVPNVEALRSGSLLDLSGGAAGLVVSIEVIVQY